MSRSVHVTKGNLIMRSGITVSKVLKLRMVVA
jgi:hypothetical protein